MAAPVLLFVVGATKAGTSWLHRYLSDHPACHMRAIKELHYFDALDFGEMDRQRQHIEGHKAWLIGRTDTDNERQFANAIRQLGHVEHWLSVLATGQEDIDAYLGYLLGGLEDETVVGDMTPAYSLLSEERLRMMAGLSEDVRFIYLMRDPVGRLWSHIRMMAHRRTGEKANIKGRANNIFERWMRGEEEQLDLRSDYAAALDKLTAAVPEDKRLILFYEDLFNEAGVSRVCDFLGIEAVPGDFDKRVLVGESLAMAPGQKRRARERLAQQYDAVAGRMGALPDAWRETERV